MTLHGSIHRNRAAKALFRRMPTKVKILEERFSPTAIFPGMTEIPDITDPRTPSHYFGIPVSLRLLIHNVSQTVSSIDIEHHGAHHLQTSEILDPTDIDPIISVVPATPTADSVSLTTPSSTLILSQMSTSSVLSIALPTVRSLFGKNPSTSMLTVRWIDFDRQLARYQFGRWLSCQLDY